MYTVLHTRITKAGKPSYLKDQCVCETHVSVGFIEDVTFKILPAFRNMREKVSMWW